MTHDLTIWKAGEGEGSLDLKTVPVLILREATRQQGVYPLVSLSAYDVMDFMKENGVEVTFEQAKAVCDHVWQNTSYRKEAYDACMLAVNILREEME